jgi:hypothetical protein
MTANIGKAVVAAALVTGIAGAALADPLSDLLKQGKGGVCYSRVYDKAHLDKHPGQQTTEVRLSLRGDPDRDGAIIRIMIKQKKRTDYVVGGCAWTAKANLDIADQPLIEAFKGPSGLNCYALTSEDGSSAEEGGDFPIDLKSGNPILLYLPDSLAAWSSFDRSEMAGFPEFGSEDQVFRLDKSSAALCREIEQKLPWLL